MAANLNRLTHKIAIQLHLVAESCTICSSRSGRPVRELLETLSYIMPLETTQILYFVISYNNMMAALRTCLLGATLATVNI
jgi:hypothetical protein